MTKNNYIFTKRMQKYIDNRFLDLIVEDYERNLSILQRKQILDFIDSKPKPKKPIQSLFMYIVFHRTNPHGYWDEVGKFLINKLDVKTHKDLDKMYKNYKKDLDLLHFPPPQVNSQVIINIKHYLSQLDFDI